MTLYIWQGIITTLMRTSPLPHLTDAGYYWLCRSEGFRVDSVRRLPQSIDDATLPRCDCGGLLRPAVVWFGEYPDDLAVVAAQTHLGTADVVLEIGVSGAVSYGFTEMAIARGAPTVRINPDAQPEQGVLTIAEPAEIALPRLVQALSK